MTIEKRVRALETRVTRLQVLAQQDTLTQAELESLTLEELAVLHHRMGLGRVGWPDLDEFQTKLDAMTDVELLTMYHTDSG